MRIERIRGEHLLYITAFGLALVSRFLALGVAPLSDFEAGWAMQALQVSRGVPTDLGPQPGYVLLTGVVFFIFGSSNALARLWPALAGSLLIWAPYLFRRRLGQVAAIILAFGLALDPGLVSLSRLAGGPMFAIGFGLLAAGLVYTRRILLAGVSTGLALLGGPAVIQGALGTGLAFSLGRYLEGLGVINNLTPDDAGEISTEKVRVGILVGGGTLLLVGTLFFKFPQGLGALAGIIPAYLGGWMEPSGVPASRLLAALVFYQPLALAFGLVAAIRGWVRRSPLSRWMSLWSVVALVMALVYPGKHVADVAWVSLPLWGLAALELSRQIQINNDDYIPALGQAALVTTLLALAWLNLAGMTHVAGDPQVFRLRWVVIAGTLALGVVTTLLVGLGWSAAAAQRGLAWGFGAALGLYTLASLWSITQLHQRSAAELWIPMPVTQDANLLLNTLEELSEWTTGFDESFDVVVTSQAPSLKWVLRNWPQARFLSSIATGELPSAIVTAAGQNEPSLKMAYRGQDFIWSLSPAWEGALPENWLAWLVFREAPLAREQVILWARGDLFPGGSLFPSSESDLVDEEEIPLSEGPAE